MAGRERLPYLDIKNFQGLYTKSTPEALRAEQLRTCQNADFFEEYGALSKIRGSSRVLTNPHAEGGTDGNKITWIEFYKAPDLDGSILRHTLVANGTKLGRVENNQITQLLTGRTAGLFHSSDMLDRFMYVSNYNPDRVGEGDDLVKYDGAVMTKWGVEAPGGKETVIDEFDSAASWTSENCTLTDQANATAGHVTWDGSAVRIDHEFYTSGQFFLEKNHNHFYTQGDERANESAIRNRISFFTYLPRGTLTASLTNPTDAGFRTNGPVISVYVSPDADTTLNNSWQFDFSNGNLFEGWNKINLNFTAGPPGGGHSAAPAGQNFGHFYPEEQVVKHTKFQFYVQTNATHIRGVRLDRYEEFDEGAPVTTVSGSGSITGVYSYKVLYVSKYGQLSNVGPKSVDITAASHGQINLTRIPLSSDSQVVARRLYRTVGNGSVWLFLDEILDNVTT
ncbi:hypothetical protein LCGC14_2180280, partial [marine sediment metagenome]